MSPPLAPPLPDRAAMARRYWIKDHGLLRIFWRNFHKLDAQVWRHNHPSRRRLARLRTMGAVSVLSFRGPDSFVSGIEAADCAAVGLGFTAIEMRAHRLPPAVALQTLLTHLRELPKPLVIHCKSGSDRTGLAACLYRHVIRGEPLDHAREELALRYIHNPWGKAGVVHILLDAYAASGKDFETWLVEDYDPKALDTRP